MRRATLLAAVFLVVISSSLALSPEMIEAQPNRPVPEPVTLDPATTALLVLDLSGRCDDTDQPCHRLAPVVGEFLPRYRANQVLIVYTVSANAAGSSQGDVWAGFEPLGPNEIVISPEGGDKFVDGEMDRILQARGITTLVVTGAATNNAVLYSVTSATRNRAYEVVLPLDGTVAAGDYEYEYTLHQFTVINGIRTQTRFSTLDMIQFTNR
jgi:nicotinamidase-related amidase